MFPFPSSSEISFEHFHGISHDEEQSPRMESVEVEENQKTREFVSSFNGDIEETQSQKKISRKESERQRRQKMAFLFTKLRSLLPLESLTGKGSVSDLVNEAENYITRLRRTIEELSLKGENLKTMAEFSSSSSQIKTSESSQISFEVRHCWGGGEILMSESYKNGGLNLCKVLKLLLHEDIEVHSLASTKVKEHLFHTFQLKIGDETSINLPDLQRKLNELFSLEQQ